MKVKINDNLGTMECHCSNESLEKSKERRYTWIDGNGRIASRKLTDYECQLEDDVQQLQDALFAISSHYAKIQFRLRQIASATDCERLCLLRELERITSLGIDKSQEHTELPSLLQDSLSMGNVRSRQHMIIAQLRKRLISLSEVTDTCFCMESESSYNLRTYCKIKKEGLDHDKYCTCIVCQEKREESAKLPASERGYLTETWPQTESELNYQTEPKKKSKSKKKHHKHKDHKVDKKPSKPQPTPYRTPNNIASVSPTRSYKSIETAKPKGNNKLAKSSSSHPSGKAQSKIGTPRGSHLSRQSSQWSTKSKGEGTETPAVSSASSKLQYDSNTENKSRKSEKSHSEKVSGQVSQIQPESRRESLKDTTRDISEVPQLQSETKTESTTETLHQVSSEVQPLSQRASKAGSPKRESLKATVEEQQEQETIQEHKEDQEKVEKLEKSKTRQSIHKENLKKNKSINKPQSTELNFQPSSYTNSIVQGNPFCGCSKRDAKGPTICERRGCQGGCAKRGTCLEEQICREEKPKKSKSSKTSNRTTICNAKSCPKLPENTESSNTNKSKKSQSSSQVLDGKARKAVLKKNVTAMDNILNIAEKALDQKSTSTARNVAPNKNQCFKPIDNPKSSNFKFQRSNHTCSMLEMPLVYPRAIGKPRTQKLTFCQRLFCNAKRMHNSKNSQGVESEPKPKSSDNSENCDDNENTDC